MKTVYYTNGELGDTQGAGLTIAAYLINEDGGYASDVMRTIDGEPFLGYMAKEVTEKEYFEWKEHIANPDRVTYFPSMFAGRGIINKKAREALDKQAIEAQAKYNERVAKESTVKFKLAKLDADAIGEDHEAVFTSKHPEIKEGVKSLLFAKDRAAKLTKKAK
jgi:hypothetical protein